MRLAIMQPYFFPYLGYFCLLKHSDHFIAFDTPQFIKQGWIDRNRILHPVASWQYMHVPLLYHPRAVLHALADGPERPLLPQLQRPEPNPGEFADGAAPPRGRALVLGRGDLVDPLE